MTTPNEWWVKQNDTYGYITEQLLDENLVGVNLAGASVAFHMKRSTDAAYKVKAAATVLDSANGIVRYAWTGTDLNTVGNFNFEWQVTFVSGKVLTFPNDGYNLIHVLKELA